MKQTLLHQYNTRVLENTQIGVDKVGSNDMEAFGTLNIEYLKYFI
jgi:hypothetical protein